MRSGSCASYIRSLVLLSLDTISRIVGMEARPSVHEPPMSLVLEQHAQSLHFMNKKTDVLVIRFQITYQIISSVHFQVYQMSGELLRISYRETVWQSPAN
jgi:hypothetical protein